MAKKQLHLDESAEREAIDVGKKYMNSTDVVGDMSRQYGADLSTVRIHHDADSAARAEQRGVDAFSTGTDVFFGRGAFNQNDPASRGLLAHELSHSLQQGVGGGQGSMEQSAPMGAEQGGLISWFKRKIAEHRAKKQAKQAKEDGEPGELPFYQRPELREHKDLTRFNMHSGAAPVQSRPGMENIEDFVVNQIGNNSAGKKYMETYGTLRNTDGVSIHGMNPERMFTPFQTGLLGGDMDQQQIADLFDNLMATREITRNRPASSFSQEELQGMDDRYHQGTGQYKEMLYQYLKQLEQKYGTMGTQMHPADFSARLDDSWYQDISLLQDCYEFTATKDEKIFDGKSEKDQEFKRLSEYYNSLQEMVSVYASSGSSSDPNVDLEISTDARTRRDLDRAHDALAQRTDGVQGPRMSRKEERRYLRDLRKRMKKSGHKNRLFGHFA